MDLTIGVGTIAYLDKSRATFDQHFGMEWGVCKIAQKFTLGIGFAVNNSYGGQFEGVASGSYDYTYKHTFRGKMYSYASNSWKTFNETNDKQRKGTGYADADIAREDINAMFTIAMHFSPMQKLDTYVKVGAVLAACHMFSATSTMRKALERQTSTSISRTKTPMHITNSSTTILTM